MDNRAKIVRAAQRMFWRQGYSTTSPRQVMAEAGVGQGSFYHHFPTKSDLGREAIAGNARDVRGAVESAMAAQTTGLDRLIAFLRSEDDAVAGCRIGGFAYDAGVLAEPALREALHAAFGSLTELLEQAVREGQEDGSISSGLDPRETAAAVFALVEGSYVLARATGSQARADSAVEGAVALLRALARG